MKILIISPSNTFPALSGGPIRTDALVKYLAKQNKIFYVYNKYHQVKEVRMGKIKFDIKSKTEFSNVRLYPIGPSIRFTQLFNPGLLIMSYKIIKKEKIDLVIGEFAWSGIYLLLLKFLTKASYIIDEHNIEYESVKCNPSLIRKWIFPLIKFYEKITWEFSKFILCVSEKDRKTIIKSGIYKKKVIVAPHGIDDDFFKISNQKKLRKKLNLPLDESIILFFGKLDYYPNKKGVDIIYKKILPRTLGKRKNIKFLIVGSNPPDIKHDKIIFTGPVENIKDYIDASDIVINPTLFSAGKSTRVIEAIACGKRVISTSIGAGELVNEGLKDFLIITDNWDDFVSAMLKNISKKHINTPKGFIEKYSLKNIMRNVNLLLQKSRGNQKLDKW